MLRPIGTIRSEVKSIRLSYGFTQKEWGERLGVGKQYISDIETGKRKASLKFVDSLCDFLALSVGIDRKAWHRAGAEQYGWML